ncbi:helix-turn-helix transcriptional regulator [Tanticharoenia sakaeratensis]|uniref:Helix-turn-helix domain-containing protein n=1 Tax=Tanticharoenia sakaeratensis NBRC 103193 TaxID=1231623 RepID=A0A0D6MP53_9PROT|nr:helix-turn-helix domain-containing protein [Tanticharoenia sakaeratensis]GAN55467.1 hypothetical protein Tasa_048_092 [Tanticharoenia sakaeratensis NBRC 103193]GBQ21994.1 hypothetical protein AA103193_1919 [Tanticharoenia sakaeratensis NBRC 103193]
MPSAHNAQTPECMSMREAARRVGISAATLCRVIARGTGPRSVQIGRRRLIRADHLAEWLDQRSTAPVASDTAS